MLTRRKWEYEVEQGQKDYFKKLILMSLPIILFILLLVIWQGFHCSYFLQLFSLRWVIWKFSNDFFLFATPIIINTIIVAFLAKHLTLKKAVLYPILQSPFVVLLFILMYFFRNTLRAFSLIFLANIVLVGICFYCVRFFNEKRLKFVKIVIITFTLLTTLTMYFVGNIGYHYARDYSRITDDGKLEYHLEIINPDMFNVRNRLVIRETTTDLERTIDLPELRYQRVALGMLLTYVVMTPTDDPSIYTMSTTQFFNPDQLWSYEINIKTGEAKSIMEISYLTGFTGIYAPRLSPNSMYTYSFYIINWEDENRIIDFYITHRETDEQTSFILNIDNSELRHTNIDEWIEFRYSDYFYPDRGSAISVEPFQDSNRYLITINDYFLLNERQFELDLNSKTLVEI